ncbi:hypothetical protein [Paenibacillus lignilyticus]|uniref:Sugar ABC transporter permease n=1 Tax=Paenibacillus lignilyticus TaxID=1172615 RepID=A0ABS5C784_9BACL|nr:hypothetical protein [Paenibacillus lignilyticus]MBP3963475.1 hypothetical protein [Paenibacillus lignilyticus]
MKSELQAATYKEIRHRSSKSWLKTFISQIDLQVMVLPGVLLVLIFSYFPMWGVLMAFQNYNLFNGFFGSDWVGLKHFEMFLHSPDFSP